METFKEHRARAIVRHIDMSAVPLTAVVQGRAKFKQKLINEGVTVESAVPEHEAFWFYLRNHAMAVLERQYDAAEPLSDAHAALLREYHAKVSESALRMYFYLIQICGRESRHAGSTDKLYAEFPELVSFHQSYKGTNQQKVLSAIFEKTPNITLGRLTKFLCASFYKCSYGGGYGGKKWGQIADVLDQFVWGKITAEMMLDTAWTLSHNNGPIFNKGMWYSMYSGAAIAELLDVQRAGMIPQYINDVAAGQAQGYAAAKFVTPEMIAYVKTMQAFTTEFNGSVDWAQLKALGALGSYADKVKAKPKVLTPAEIAAKQKAEQEAIEAKKSQWQILPGVYAKKEKPVRQKQAQAA
ncbi:MAG TPA: hypothetical protein VGD46_13365 [Rhizobacter sp.]